MAQPSPHYCSRCGAEMVPHQNFCPTCGLPQALQASGQSGSPSGAPAYVSASQTAVPAAQRVAVLNPPAPSGKRRIGPIGTILLLIALLLVLAAVGYSVFQVLGIGKPTQAPITKTSLNTTVTYADVNMTIVNVQQAKNFLDDPRTAMDGMLRVQIQARNTARQPITLVYSTVAHLVQPNGKELAAAYASANPTLAVGATQTSTVDFVLPITTRVDQLTLRLGAADEAQLDIPLNGHADGSKYAAKTVKLAKELIYLNMNWTLIDGTSQLSFDGQQAKQGMKYIILTLSVHNPLMQTVVPGSPYVYMHLTTSAGTTIPVSATMPVSIDAGASGKTGTAIFQVPQGDTSFTFTLSTPGNTGFDPATTTFQIS